ncbi:MAG: hypothetical protein JO333_11990 [Verrucomicrobia bacterium]|nr:hypothetical protein [Verrucomicrobiota bacterium]
MFEQAEDFELCATSTASLDSPHSGRSYWSCGDALFDKDSAVEMKFSLACLMIVLAHSSFGQSADIPEEPEHIAEKMWKFFAQGKRDAFEIMNGVSDPLLKQKASRLIDALTDYNISTPARRLEWVGVDMAPNYVLQLTQDYLEIETADNAVRSRQTVDHIHLVPALDDMYLKVNACILNRGTAIGSVSVEVHTKKSGLEVSNWRVICIAKILRLYPNFSPTMFPQLSSPTKWSLAPGNYIMWAEDPQTGNKSATQEIPIDKDQECDLTVP